MRTVFRSPGAGRLLVTLAVATACALSPASKKARHLQRGDQYFDQKKYAEAILEYENALKYPPEEPRAVSRLGLAHFEIGELNRAFAYLTKARDLDPGNMDVRIKLGALYGLSRDFAKSRAEAEAVLQRDPGNLDALSLLAEASSTPQELSGWIKRIEAMGPGSQPEKFHRLLGMLHVRSGDVAAAERSFKQALQANARSADVHLALGRLYLLKRDPAQAETEFKAAAAASPPSSIGRMALVDFYVQSGRAEDAKRELTAILGQAPDLPAARLRLAQIAFAAGRHDEAAKELEPVLRRNPLDNDARLLQGRVLLAREQTGQAIQEFQAVLKQDVRSVPAHVQLAMAHLKNRDMNQAKSQLQQAIDAVPDNPEPVLLLAQLNLQTGAVQPAIDALERLVKTQPHSAATREVLGRAYLQKGDAARAVDTFQQLTKLTPGNPRPRLWLGRALLKQGKRAEARAEFEAALRADPKYVDPLLQLASMDVDEKKPDAALARVDRQIAVAPEVGAFHYARGTIMQGKGDTIGAEAAFLESLRLEPRLMGSYGALARLYHDTGRFDQALAALEKARAVDPNDVVVHMFAGLVHQGKGDIAQARSSYEQALAVNPRFAPAANNLAWLYSEHGGDPDKALELAQRAKEIEPEDPTVSDTLGWILYKRGHYQRALPLLKESAEKQPNNAAVLYHLGMTYLKIGDTQAARQAISRALTIDPELPAADEARRLLTQS